MVQVRLKGAAADGKHLVLDREGEELLLPVDDALRTALREATQLLHRAVDPDASVREYTPREIQAMMRAGKSVQDVAVDSGWSPDRVARYEAPILAERDHVAALARNVVLRGRASATTLEARVRSRLQERGVDPEDARWDALRPQGEPWIVRVDFEAGDKPRTATWEFDLASRRLTATSDEARWLAEEEDAAPAPTSTPLIPQTRTGQVFDVEAQGGLEQEAEPLPVERPRRTVPRRADGHSEPVDLMTAMRERGAARQRRKTAREGGDAEDVEALPPLPERPATAPAPDMPAAYPPAAHERGGPAAAVRGPVADGPAAPASEDDAERTGGKGRRGGARRSVPSWDDIMFGKKD